MRMVWPALSLAFLAACADIIGIESLGIEPPTKAPSDGGGVAPDAGALANADADALVDSAVTPAIDAPPPLKHVFVTSDTMLGNFGGLEAADIVCNAAAKRGSLDASKWIAWLSETVSGADVNAIDRIPNGPFYNLGDVQVALDKNQLKLGLTVPITMTEMKATASNDVLRVWTGTNANGVKAGGPANGSCFDWTNSSGAWPGVAGVLTSTANWTTSDPPNGCGQKARLYCFEL